MAAAASTGTVLVGALAGGVGVLVGTVVTQVVQLFRDKTQYRREEARHEREREEALEDDRRKRREDRYVTLLTDLTELDGQLHGLTEMLPELVRNRQLVDAEVAAGRSGDVWRAVAAILVEVGQRTWQDIEHRHRELATSVLATYAVASLPVRAQCLVVTGWPLVSAGVPFRMLTETEFPELPLMEASGSRYVSRSAYADNLLATLNELRGHIDKLDGLLRGDLRLD